MNAISEEDVAGMVAKQVEKAKDGDTKAVQFVLGFVAKAAPAPQPVVRRPLSVRDGDSARKEAKAAARLRRRMAVAKLLANGPQTPAEIAAAIGVAEARVPKLLDHAWFTLHANGRQYQITTLGRKDGLGGT